MSAGEGPLTETVEKRVSTPMGVKKVRVPKDLRRREDEMKAFFEGMEEPSPANPNLRKKADGEAGLRKQLSDMVDLDVFWNGLLAYRPFFQAEREVLDYLVGIRSRMQMACGSLFLGGFGALALGGPLHFDARLKVAGACVSVLTGVIFAKLKVNQYSADVITR